MSPDQTNTAEAVERLTDEERRILVRLAETVSGGASTSYISGWGAHPIDGVRRVCRRLARRNLLEPQPYTSGRTYHWRITDAGRAAARVLTEGVKHG